MGLYDAIKESFIKKDVWIPSVSALALGLSNQDGALTDYASREKPLFGSTQNAKNYSDIIAFYYFPAINIFSKGYSHYRTPDLGSKIWHYSKILIAPTMTFLFNRFLKNSSGRLRPDSSDRLSFPSSHTAIASSFSEGAFHSGANFFTPTNLYRLNTFNEALVASVGWARLEAQKHHLTDVLVGYSIGKFMAHFCHLYFFDQSESVHTEIGLKRDKVNFNLVWEI